MMGHHEKAKDADERDVVSRVRRRVLKFLSRPGMAREIKTRMARHVRREARKDLRKDQP